MTPSSTRAHASAPQAADAGFLASSYDLTLDYKVATNRLDAVAVVACTTLGLLEALDLSLTGLRVTEVLVDGARPARWRHRAGALHIDLARPLAADVGFEVSVRYGGSPAPLTGPWGEVGWEELTDGVLVAGQPDGAASWFPCVNAPASKATFHTTVTVESSYTVVCNGALVARTTRAGRNTWRYEMRQPMAAYLATVQVGRYQVLTLADVPVRQLLVAPPALSAAAMIDLSRQAQMMELFCASFGPYPFDQYTVVVTEDPLEIPVEAQGMSTFGSNHLDGAGQWERLVAHELAHQWFGNALTVARWSDIWLHEGFACYAEWLWSEASGGRTAHDIAVATRAMLAEGDAGLSIGNPEPARMFDDVVYKRGALTLHALRLTVGDEHFFATLRAWTAENAYGSVDTEGLVATCERVAGVPLGELFEAWLGGPPVPQLPVPAAARTRTRPSITRRVLRGREDSR